MDRVRGCRNAQASLKSGWQLSVARPHLRRDTGVLDDSDPRRIGSRGTAGCLDRWVSVTIDPGILFCGGGLLWIVSFDLVRHRPVVRYLSVTTVRSGVALLSVNWLEGWAQSARILFPSFEMASRFVRSV